MDDAGSGQKREGFEADCGQYAAEYRVRQDEQLEAQELTASSESDGFDEWKPGDHSL